MPKGIFIIENLTNLDSLLETDLDGIVFIAADPSVWNEPVQRAIDRGITPGVNLYRGEYILPEDAPDLIERESGGQARVDWYDAFIAENELQEFGLD